MEDIIEIEPRSRTIKANLSFIAFFSVLFVVGVALGVFAQRTRSSSGSIAPFTCKVVGAPVIAKQLDTPRFYFQVTNNLETPVTITKLVSTCSCTKLDSSIIGKTVEGGGTISIPAHLDVGLAESTIGSKLIAFGTDDSGRQLVGYSEINIGVEELVSLSPPFLDFGNVGGNEVVEQNIQLICTDGTSEIAKIVPEGKRTDSFEIREVSRRGDGRYQLKVACNGERFLRGVDSDYASFVIELSNSRIDKKLLRVRAVRLAAAIMRPTEIVFSKDRVPTRISVYPSRNGSGSDLELSVVDARLLFRGSVKMNHNACNT
jgi:hypothetical protein